MPSIGSPPRVWGNHDRADRRRAAAGSPPRVWGNPPALGYDPAHAVHPHACGEICVTWTRAMRSGSPPRVGKSWLPHIRCHRFTPTRVGKSPAIERSPAVGSPPRVWGNRARCLAPCRSRFTPTRVGKSAPMPASRLARVGSPPRVWGNRLPMTAALSTRFTPTRVGKSRLRLA